MKVFGGKWSVTGFYEMYVIQYYGMQIGRRVKGMPTLITLRSFSDPLTPRILSLWRSWTGKRSIVSFDAKEKLERGCKDGGRSIETKFKTNDSIWTTLTHQAAKPLECPRNTHVGVDLNKNPTCGVDIYLQKTCLIEWRI